jgi:hypothetical protein
LLNFAGVAACLIAPFPMSQRGDCEASHGWSIHSVHGFAAAAVFIAIALVCYWYPAEKYIWSKLCAAAMVVTIGFAVVYYLSPKLGLDWKGSLCQHSAVFFIEAVAVYAFGLYWCFKSADAMLR